MEDDEWQELSRELLGDAAETEPAEAARSQEQLLMPGTGMDVSDWDGLVNELLAGPTVPSVSSTSSGGNNSGNHSWPDVSMDGGHGRDDEGSLPAHDPNLDDAHLGFKPSTEPCRKRGRPPGIFGSRKLQEALRSRQASQQAEDPPVGNEPGTIAYAREFKKQKKAAAIPAGAVSLPLPGMATDIWNSLKNLASSATQKALVFTAAAASAARGRKAAGQGQMSAEEASEDSFLQAVFEDKRDVLTQTQFASKCGLQKNRSASLFVSAASAALEGARVLWGTFFRALDARLDSESGGWIPVLLCHRCRYDETPTLTRIHAQQCKDIASASDVSKHGKVVQSEGSIHVLLANADRSKFLEFTGRIPTTLQVVEDTSAVCLRRVRCNVLGIDSIPEMLAISSKFPWTLQQATVDRYAANFRAESALLHDVLAAQEDGAPLTSKATLPCDIHRIHQAHSSSFKLVTEDISGLLSASLCQQAGSLDAWREILSTVLEQRLVIYYDTPPQGWAAQHRSAVLDLFLPAGSDAKGRLQNERRRYVLQNTLNGYIDSKEVAHYCSFGCCQSREETYRKIRKFTVAALLPSKLQLFAKNRWAKHFDSVSFCGLLSAYHGLLEPLLLAYTGGPIKAVSGQDDQARQTVAEGTGDAILDMLAGEMGLEVSGGHAVAEAAAHVPDDEPEAENGQGDEGAVNPAEVDWVTLNKQFKQKAALWGASHPAARLTFLAMSITAMAQVMHPFLAMSGDEWELKQRQLAMAGTARSLGLWAGEPRTYRLLVAARGQHEENALAALLAFLDETPLTLSQEHFTLHFRSLAFRLFSRVGCALHWLLRVPHCGWPYALFKVLDGDTTVLRNTPACCLDELGAAYLQQYPLDTCTYQPGTEEYAVLAFLAENLHIDIAGIESRHAALRRLSLKKSLQTWITNFQHLSAEFTCRQVAACRRRESAGTSTAGQPSDAKPPKNHRRKNKKPGTGGGGGGPFRAYLHVHYRGQRGTPDLWQKAGEEWRSLSDEDKQPYRQLGLAGLRAWREGFRAFGTNVQEQNAGPRPGDVVAGGAVVAADAPRHNMELVPQTSIDLRDELRKLTSEQRSRSRQQKEAECQQMEIMRAAETQLLATSAADVAVFTDVPVKEGLSHSGRVSGRSWGLRNKLTEAFCQHTEIVRNKDQPRIKFDPAVQRRMFSAKPCSKLGICICGAAGNGHTANQVHQRIAADLKRICWSRKKEKSSERLMLEAGKIVLRLHASDDADAEFWYHVGFANYTTWRLTFHKLLRVPGDVQPLQDTVLLRSVCMEMERQDVRRTAKTFMTSVHALASDINFVSPCSMSLYAIVDSSATVSFERMKPGYVQVVACRSDSGDCLEMSVWRGQAAEDEDAAEQQRLRGRRRRGERQSCAERQPKTRGGRPQQAAAAVQNQDEDDAAEPAESEAQAILTDDSEAMQLEEDADAASSASEAGESGGESDAELDDDGDEGLGLLDALLAEMRAEDREANAGDVQLDRNSTESSSSDSSSSSSTSSSDSSSSPDSDGEDEAAERQGAAGPRAPAIAEHVFELEGGLGQIRYNVAQEVLIARCGVHGENCRRRRATTSSHLPRLRGQGRPIGLLVSWLMRAHEEESAHGHVKMKPSPLCDRRAAREAFYRMEGS
ncbi:unnamed protein product, partial [Symbiodinium sp. CCMP2456]